MSNPNDSWILLFVFLACVVAPLLLLIGGALLTGGIIAGRRSALKSTGRAPDSPAPASASTRRPPARQAGPLHGPSVAAPSVHPVAAQPTRSPAAEPPVTRRAAHSPASAPTARRPDALPPATRPTSTPNRCPQCGYSNRPGAHFCANCRRNLAAAPSPAPENLALDAPAPAKTPAVQAVAVFDAPALVETPAAQERGRDAFCWNCGQALRPTSRFCPRCGSPI